MDISAETWAFIKEHQSDDTRTLALQAGKYPNIDIPTAICQIAGRQIAAEKIPSWYHTDGIVYPQHLPLEQCSSELTARFKSSLVKGNSLVDLTGGFGIDCSFLSGNFQQTTYVERQKQLCDIAQHNFSRLGLNNISIENSDSIEHLQRMPAVDCIYIDPARRNQHGGKTIRISDCEPNIEEIEPLLLQKASTVLIKLSSMLDLSLAIKTLSSVSEAYIISVKNDCKELLLVLNRDTTGDVPIHCINILNEKQMQTFIFTRQEEAETICEFVNEVEQYLYEPNASILKAGAFKSIAHNLGLKKLHPSSHLYTSASFIKNFPGKSFKVLQYGSIKEKQIIQDIKQANIATRNFPLSPPELRKRLKIQEGGDIFLFGTTLNNNKKILIKAEKLV